MPYSERFAVLADIHGNAAALAAVLDDARSRGVTGFVNLGDTFYGPLDPAGTWAILERTPMTAVLGNQDRLLLEAVPPGMEAAVDRVRRAVGPDGMQWLSSLPHVALPSSGVVLCHGRPGDDTAYLLEDVRTGRPRRRPCADILADLPRPLPSLVLTGHSHLYGHAACDSVTVVNPGSVGLPAYTDDAPPHVMASGGPHARYAIVTRNRDGWEVELLPVEYDWDAAANLARENGREDWARWLSTGLD